MGVLSCASGRSCSVKHGAAAPRQALAHNPGLRSPRRANRWRKPEHRPQRFHKRKLSGEWPDENLRYAAIGSPDLHVKTYHVSLEVQGI